MTEAGDIPNNGPEPGPIPLAKPISYSGKSLEERVAALERSLRSYVLIAIVMTGFVIALLCVVVKIKFWDPRP